MSMTSDSRWALEWAIQKHKDQQYSTFPYSFHLKGVIGVAKRFGRLYFNDQEYDRVLCGCALHDTLEDCNITYNDIIMSFTTEIADDVYDVTNELGKTRQERSKRTYKKIKRNKYALFIKLCDRIANTLFSLYNTEEGNMFKVYMKDYPSFRDALYSDLYPEMWKELDLLSQVHYKK